MYSKEQYMKNNPRGRVWSHYNHRVVSLRNAIPDAIPYHDIGRREEGEGRRGKEGGGGRKEREGGSHWSWQHFVILSL